MPPPPAVWKLKRIINPNDPNNPDKFYIPVRTTTPTKDGRGQAYIKGFDNTQQNNARTVHTHTVYNQTQDAQGNITIDQSGSNQVDVERIDIFAARNAYQKENAHLKNDDPPPLPAPSDPSYDPTLGHWKSHVVRYNFENTNDPGSVPWADIEYVDKAKLRGLFTGSKRRQKGQATFIQLEQPAGDDLNDGDDPFNPTWAKRDDTLDMLPDDPDAGPCRLDPFQNIVNIQWGIRFVIQGIGLNATVDEDNIVHTTPDPFPTIFRHCVDGLLSSTITVTDISTQPEQVALYQAVKTLPNGSTKILWTVSVAALGTPLLVPGLPLDNPLFFTNVLTTDLSSIVGAVITSFGVFGTIQIQVGVDINGNPQFQDVTEYICDGYFPAGSAGQIIDYPLSHVLFAGSGYFWGYVDSNKEIVTPEGADFRIRKLTGFRIRMSDGKLQKLFDTPFSMKKWFPSLTTAPDTHP